MRASIKAILQEATYYDRPEAFELDLARDIEYLYNHNSRQFVWVLYRNGTQLFPAATDIPSPFVGNPAFGEVSYAEAFLRTYGDGANNAGTAGGDTHARWFIFDNDTLTHTSAPGCIAQLERWMHNATTAEVPS